MKARVLTLILSALSLGATPVFAHHSFAMYQRDKTMILVWGGREGRWVDWDLWNPYSIGSNH